MAWFPTRVSCTTTDEFGRGRGIWLGSIFDGPVWLIADIAAMVWVVPGGGIPYILGGCTEPGIEGVTWNFKNQLYNRITEQKGLVESWNKCIEMINHAA